CIAMVPTLFFYQLMLIVLMWVFLLLYWLGPTDPAAPGPALTTLTPPRHKRSQAPKPFAGLTRKPYCAACEQEVMHPAVLSPVPPAPMPPTHRQKVAALPTGDGRGIDGPGMDVTRNVALSGAPVAAATSALRAWQGG